MKISIGSDHGGFLLKEAIKKHLLSQNYDVLDEGCNSLESVHYPLYASYVCEDVLNGCDFGILVCTTGIGMSIAANKYRGIRAALVTNLESAMLTRKHNNSNVICLGAKYTSFEDAFKFVDAFISSTFEGGRHQIRVDMIQKIEERK